MDAANITNGSYFNKIFVKEVKIVYLLNFYLIYENFEVKKKIS